MRGLGARAVIGNLRSKRWKKGEGIYRARITFRAGGTEHLAPGTRVRLLAVLMPPPSPSAPGEYDFGRWAFYRGIGAVGYAFGKAEPAGPAPSDLFATLGNGAENLRSGTTARIRKAVPGPEGPIVAALITGERADIPDADNDAYRDAGLSHILSISGLHLALAGGIFFYVLRALLAAVPTVALNYPIKKWAALAALSGATFYLAISGGGAAAFRSYIMLAVMFIAILVDRPALAMRSVTFAALLLLLLSPESLLDPGFQMSFAAVIALIAFAEWEQSRPQVSDAPKGLIAKALRYARGIVVTSLLAGFATAPFVIFHFDRVSLYGTLANLLSLPLAGFAIMPAAVAALIAMPFGLETWPLLVMAAGVRAMTAIAHWVSSLPGASAFLPAWSGMSLLLVALGGLWIAVWRKPWRWLGGAPIAVGLLLTLFVVRPDILIGQDGYDIAVRLPNGKLGFARKPLDDFVARNWLERDGDGRDPESAMATRKDGVACDSQSCIFRKGRILVAMPVHREATREDCARAVMVIAAIPTHRNCPAAHVIDNLDIRTNGNYAIWLAPFRIETVRESRGRRPWSVYPAPRPRRMFAKTQ
jgi:competence protein ComEC